MRDKLLTYALAASIGLHLMLLGVVGKTSAARPIAVEQLKIVHVDLVKVPPEAAVEQEKQEKPEAPKPKAEVPKPEVPFVPNVSRMVTHEPPPKREQRRPGSERTSREPRDRPRPLSPKQAGDPGGPLAGVTAPNGDDLGYVPTGSTPPGWVPGSERGTGQGSGSGPGIGRPDPVPDARPGPGRDPAPEPPPVQNNPPPPPKMVTLAVCATSGDLPGRYCDRKDSRSFREGSEPQRTCSACKAPEPRHVSTVADRKEPELVKDSQVKIPPLDESGEFTVRIRYTVNTDGSVGDVEITDSSGTPAIDRAVRDAASKMRYKPAVQNGEPRAVKIKRKYRIRL